MGRSFRLLTYIVTSFWIRSFQRRKLYFSDFLPAVSREFYREPIYTTLKQQNSNSMATHMHDVDVISCLSATFISAVMCLID